MRRPFSRVLAVTGSILIGLAGAVALATPASAHHTTITSSVTCLPSGFKITWKVTNSEQNKIATITKVETTGSNAPIDGFGVGTTIAKSGNVTGTQTVADGIDSVKLTVSASWPGATNKNDGYVNLKKVRCEGTVRITGAGECDSETGNWKVSWSVVNDNPARDGKVSVRSSGQGELTSIKVGDAWQAITDESVIVGLKDDDVIAKGASAAATQAVPGNATAARLSVRLDWGRDDKGTALADVTFQGTCVANTPEPNATFSWSCEGVTVTLINAKSATKSAIFEITGGNGFTATKTVAPGTEDSVFIPAANAGSVTVTSGRASWPYSWQDSGKCHPVDIESSSTCDKLIITLKNPKGGAAAEYTLTPSTGDPVVKTVAPDSTVTVDFPGSTGLTVKVTKTSVESGEKKIAAAAVVEGDTYAWTKPADCKELPVTGDNVALYTASGLALVALGVAVFLVARRRRLNLANME